MLIRRLICLGLAIAISSIGVLYGWEVAKRSSLHALDPTPILYDRHGEFLTQVGQTVTDAAGARTQYGFWRVDPMPQRVAQATLALEDRRFWSHPGVDPIAVVRALWQNRKSGRHASGASTLAMQVARMQNPAPRTLWAKSVEAGVAVVLTMRYGREAMLAHYLRLVPYGNESHGIAHAARWYFDKPVQDLSWAEIALLSAVPQSPARMNLYRPDGYARAVARGRRALDELLRLGTITSLEHAIARDQIASLRPVQRSRRDPAALHAALRLSKAALARQPEHAEPRLRTTIDLRLQRMVTELARRGVETWRKEGAEQAAVLVVERATGEVLVTVGSVGYASHSGSIDFTRIQRSPGSTLKPFIYALALEDGLLKTDDILADLPEGSSGISNADGHYLGPMLPRQALANSRNVPAVNLLRTLGLKRAFRFFQDLELHDLEVLPETFGLSMAIGSLPTRLERLVRAYTSLANDGRLLELAWFKDGRQRVSRQVLSSDTARLVTHFLADPLARLPSFPRYGATEYPFPVALKTGTSQGYRDAWLIGWSQRYLVGVWVGRGDAGTMHELTGARAAAALARPILLKLHGSLPGDLVDASFPAPRGYRSVELCMNEGKDSAGSCGQMISEWIPENVDPPLKDATFRIQPDRSRLIIPLPSLYREWQNQNHYPVADRQDVVSENVRISITAPENNSRIWRNPEAPKGAGQIQLKVTTEPPVPQVVWYVDGQPFAVADPDKPTPWPLTPGEHYFEARLPFRMERSASVRIVVE
ncbi:transglycosylase domain-containing protein [Microvirga solisilvae]|uniref:transglycosylase domain-containing protein n=1 Tax=Microvirga solisilvae TaxID=2919498 RepID=UPI001FAF0749|nr:transglycosylase domain-containing protein [Microvirga solisilvae]